MGKNALLEAGLLLGAVARKICRHNGEFDDLELRVLRLHVETGLSMIPKLPQPGEQAAEDGAPTPPRGRTPNRRPKPDV
jgi:hypothetical protein